MTVLWTLSRKMREVGDYCSVDVQRTLEFLPKYRDKDWTTLQAGVEAGGKDFYYRDNSIHLMFGYNTAALNKIILEAPTMTTSSVR
jgi:hypothetical protein